MKKNKKKISFQTSGEQYSGISWIAERHNLSISLTLRLLIEWAIREYKDDFKNEKEKI